MNVEIVHFPETPVAVLEHRGPPETEHESIRKFIEWRRANGLRPDRHKTYGVHYTDPRTTPPADYRVDLCVSIQGEVAPNAYGIVRKAIPAGRCAVARHLGSRENVTTAVALYEEWFPKSGETLRGYPIFFHYVNVGPDVREEDMITDVYLPIQ